MHNLPLLLALLGPALAGSVTTTYAYPCIRCDCAQSQQNVWLTQLNQTCYDFIDSPISIGIKVDDNLNNIQCDFFAGVGCAGDKHSGEVTVKEESAKCVLPDLEAVKSYSCFTY